jgi:hypothetical protein
MKYRGITRLLVSFVLLLGLSVGGAWAASYNVMVNPTLDSTGKHLTLEFTFYEDGNKVSPLANAKFDKLAQYFDIGIGVRVSTKADDTGGFFKEFHSETQTYAAGSITATYVETEPFEEAHYLFSYFEFHPTDTLQKLYEGMTKDGFLQWIKEETGLEFDPEEMEPVVSVPYSKKINEGKSIYIEKSTDNGDDNNPPTVDDNTTAIIKDGEIVSISVNTNNASPIPAGIWFKIWLFSQDKSSVRAASDYIGPFIVESKAGALDIDVDDLKNPDGSKASIAAGSYIVKFADGDEKYVGTTAPITLKATGESTNNSNDNNSGGGGGGCDVGMGGIALLLAGVLAVSLKKKW